MKQINSCLPRYKREIKNCGECGKEFETTFRSSTSKYCGEYCRNSVSRRSSKSYRKYQKVKMLSDADLCSSITHKRYKRSAEIRGLSFNLTLDDFKSNINKSCYYCGKKYNGIGFDRIDSNTGYEVGNVKPCCKHCNLMKRDMSLNDFILACKNISDRHYK